jgi:hypothetical protein
MLPVSKKEVVQSKVYSFIILEMIHLVLALIFGIIHNVIYGSANYGLEINTAFFGLMFVIVAVFNIIFLPYYFKTGYRFGKPLIVGVIATLLIAGFFEYSMFKFQFIIDIFKAPELSTQLIVLLVGVVLFVISSIITMKQSITNYENIS